MRCAAHRILLLLASLLAACGGLMSDSEMKGGDPDPPDGFCYGDGDCLTGLVCLANQCVSPDDELPPEIEDAGVFQRPVATADHVFALSTGAGSVAIVDPVSLRITAVTLPDEPVGLAVFPGREAAVIVSRRGKTVSYLDRAGDNWTLRTQRTPRQFGAVALSPDGTRAVLWTPDGQTPDDGAEGLVGIVDIAALATGVPAPIVERAAGRRHANVFFRLAGGAAVDAVVVGADEVAVIDLAALDANPVPDRIRLPDGFTSPTGREALATPDGSRLLFRSFLDPALLIFDVATRLLAPLPLPAVATDIDLSADGALAVVALRSSLQVAWFPLADPGAIQIAAVAGVIPGQVELSADASFVLLFSSTDDSETLGRLDLTAAAPEVQVLGFLQKWIRAVGLSPDGTAAVVIHRPNPGSTVADVYEREVDQDEGYSVVDLTRGVAQLKRTLGVPPVEAVFSPDGAHAAVTLRDDARKRFAVDAIDLDTLIASSLPLASAPEFAGAMHTGTGRSDRIWVTQAHPAGRISFVDLADRAVRTTTGFQLNADID